MGCPDPRPATTERWARASARLSLVALMGWALALAPVAAGLAHALAATPVGPVAALQHVHGAGPPSGASGEPSDEAPHHTVHCLACLVGAWTVLTSMDVDVGQLPPVQMAPPLAPLVAEEHNGRVRSRAPPPASAAG